ncbi:AsmA family protein [Luteimonas sp. RD2P54]|uniref:AsmA family protein n=1 Tax=Luteimonas endophytica TaxID=3042023 RepID=A0ABT6J9V7_9GAMM|nr:AsmA family protein [Luteimonas endophytica]MDH5823534.1 AsmA family protein [Luteimonas endophytica]
MATDAPRTPRAIAIAADHPWWSALAAVALAVLAMWLFWDWNWFKGAVERGVESRIGRSFEIGGDLDVDPALETTIRADDLRLGNASWAKETEMASADRLELRISLASLFTGRGVRIPDIRLTKPRLRLETGPEGGGNWDFARSGDGDRPRLERLWIEEGRLLFVDAAHDTLIDARVASREPQREGAAPPVGIAGEGRWRGNPFRLEGSAQSPLDLQDTENAYRLDLHATAGTTRAHARGALVDPFRLERFDLQMALSGRDLEDLYPLLGIAMPSTPPYSLDGRFRREGDTWRYTGFEGKVGDSDLAGDVTVEAGGERPVLRADLTSDLLDLDDLAGFIGAPPQSGDGETANETQRERAQQQATSDRVLPDTPYALDKLHAMDADVRLRARRIDAPTLPLDDMEAHLLLESGQVTLDPLNFGVAGGDIRATVRMDSNQQPIRTRLDARIEGLQLARLFPDSALAKDAVGAIGGVVGISGTGNSVAKMLGSADGDIAVGMGPGKVSNLLVEFAGVDIAEALRFLITGDRIIPVRCAFGDFAVRDGVMEARALAFDTTDTIILGEGSISLRDETLDLVLKPRPKDRSILSLRSPLVADGTFRDPSFRPDMGRLGLRGALAITLGTIAPPAALLAMLELGGGEDSSCGGQYAE